MKGKVVEFDNSINVNRLDLEFRWNPQKRKSGKTDNIVELILDDQPPDKI